LPFNDAQRIKVSSSFNLSPLPKMGDSKQSGINMVDLMMWLVIAALLLAAAIQGIGYYQKATFLHQMKSDLAGAGSNVMAVVANTDGIINADAADEGVLNTKWSKEVGHAVELPSDSSIPYLRATHPGVPDFDVIYLFKECAPFTIGVNVVPKTGSTLLDNCGVSASPDPTVTPDPDPTETTPVVPPAKTMLAGWGYNANSQLGTGDTTHTSTATPMSVANTALVDQGVTAVGAGSAFSCAISDNSVYCWGKNDRGQLGNGTFVDSTTPVKVVGISGTLSSLAVGGKNACVIGSGTVYCWGDASAGQLGLANNVKFDYTDGVYTPVWDNKSNVAVVPTGLMTGKTATKVSASDRGACAVVTEGDVYCWGDYNNSRLGDGTENSAGSMNPVKVIGLTGKAITDLSVGSYQTCVVADTEAYCWGKGDSGQLGNGANDNSGTPVKVAGPLAGKAVTKIASGSISACAVSGGEAYCWGKNYSGMLGNGSYTNSMVPANGDTNVPVKVVGLSGVTFLDLDAKTTCAVASGAAYCWGFNGFGGLGNGEAVPNAVDPMSGSSTADKYTPVAVVGLSDKTVSEVYVGNWSTVALYK
jgi:alpha-tubulin suppressor-like RCC1 family protein